MSKLQEVRRVKKNLPYTVTGIQDVAVWRAEQTTKEEIYQLEKQVRHNKIVQALTDGTIGNKVFEKSQVTKNYERLAKNTEALAAYINESSNKTIKAYKCPPPKPSIFQRVAIAVTDWFCSIKF